MNLWRLTDSDIADRVDDLRMGNNLILTQDEQRILEEAASRLRSREGTHAEDDSFAIH